MKHKVVLATAALAGGLVLLTPGIAFAQTDAAAVFAGAGCGGPYGEAYASFTAQGEIFKAYDNCPDGHSAVNEYKIGSGAVRQLWDHSGAGGGDPATFNASIAEGVNVQIRACIGEYGDGTILGCTSWRSGVA